MTRKGCKGFFSNAAHLLLLGILAFSLMLTGCGTSGQTAEPAAEGQDTAQTESGETQGTAQADPSEAAGDSQAPAEPVEITFWHTYGDAEAEVFTNEVLPMWNESNPNITVNAVRHDAGQFHNMIVTSFGTGDSPDVARIDIVNTATYAKAGGLLALSGMPDYETNKSLYLEGPLSTNLYQGEYYGLPLDTNCKAAVINTNILNDELGITGTDFTMEDFILAAEARGAQGKYSLNVSGVGDWDMYPLFWLFGGVLTDEAFTSASGYLDGDASVQAVEKLLELHEKKIFTIRDVDGSVDAWDGINTDYAMFFEGPWFFGAYEEKEAAGIVAAPIPTYNGKTASVVGGENIVVFSTAEQQDAAYNFAKFMTTEPVQQAMLKTGQLPILKQFISHPDITSNPVWNVYMEQLNEGAYARIPSPNQVEIGQAWSDMMLNIFNGGEVKAELTNAAQLIDGLLAS